MYLIRRRSKYYILLFLISIFFIYVHKNNFHRQIPNAVIIGAAKCGTETLLRFLGHNSKVHNSFHSEVQFYDKFYYKGFDWYLEQFPKIYTKSDEVEILLEKSPQYLKNPLVPNRILETNPQTKIILIVRDPFQRIVSHFMHYKANLEQKFNKEIDLKFEDLVLNRNGDFTGFDHDWISDGLYHQHFQKWLQVFPLEQILILNGDRLIEEPWREIQRAELFLGVMNEVGSQHNFVFNEEKGFFCYVKDPKSCHDRSKGRKHPKIDSEVEKKIRKFYQEENEKFFNLISYKFDWN